MREWDKAQAGYLYDANNDKDIVKYVQDVWIYVMNLICACRLTREDKRNCVILDGANVSVLPGVTIGDNTIIGAGSVVNRDIPPNVIAVGNPCRVMRSITEEDKNKYREYME